MRWYAISGSWRKTNEQVKADVVREVRRILAQGGGIVTGGALGVDYLATKTVLDGGDSRSSLKLFLPIHLEDFCTHYLKRAKEGVITQSQAEQVTRQLREVQSRSPESIFDDFGFDKANVESYYARNTKIVEAADELLAFQVNESQGTQDAITKALDLNRQVRVWKYTIE